MRTFLAAAVFLTFLACVDAPERPAAATDDPVGTVVVALELAEAPPALATVRLRLFRPDASPVEREQAASHGRVVFQVAGLAEGAWSIVLDGRTAAGEVLLCGRGEAEVVQGALAQAAVALVPASSCDPFEFACQDTQDDDGDGATDCQDTDCDGALCDDGDACTVAEVCADGVCAPGKPRTCDDGDACNGLETCDSVTGCVPGKPLACDDGNVCNGLETCTPTTGCVPGKPLACDDGDACNGLETCAPAAGCVPGTPLACDDGNACNGVEACAPATGCVPGTALSCDDGVACTIDTCQPAGGCVHDTGGCECLKDADCGAAPDVCAQVHCVPATLACETSPAPDGTPCDDGNGCTSDDACLNGACTATAAADDALEDNDGLATATPIVPGPIPMNLVIAGDDEDWLVVDVCPGAVLTLAGEASDPLSASAIAYELRNAAGVLAGGTFQGPLDLTHVATYKGPLYLRFRVLLPTSCNRLELTVTQDSSACFPPENCQNGIDDDGDGLSDCADQDCDQQTCTDGDRCTTGDLCNAGTCAGTRPADAHEPNDSLAAAVPLTLGVPLTGLLVADGEIDFFKVPVVSGTKYTFTFTASDQTLVDVGYFQFTLRRADGATLAGGTSFPEHSIVLPWSSFITGDVYLEVKMAPPNGCNGYSVLVTSP